MIETAPTFTREAIFATPAVGEKLRDELSALSGLILRRAGVNTDSKLWRSITFERDETGVFREKLIIDAVGGEVTSAAYSRTSEDEGHVELRSGLDDVENVWALMYVSKPDETLGRSVTEVGDVAANELIRAMVGLTVVKAQVVLALPAVE